MIWIALVPLKPEAGRKTRLAAALDPADRVALSYRLFDRVCAALRPHAAICVVSPAPPPGWTGRWIKDTGEGLNAALEAALAEVGAGPVVIVHADLMFVEPDDISALLAAAESSGAAIAPDGADSGTNALALADGRRPALVFGADSFARFGATLGQPHAVVRRPGLAQDCDTPDDLRRLAGGSRDAGGQG
ncbi:MAG TPA: 2-phospho-L-lactate guanylyltransferase [Novosphingobium sp.]